MLRTWLDHCPKNRKRVSNCPYVTHGRGNPIRLCTVPSLLGIKNVQAMCAYQVQSVLDLKMKMERKK